MRAEATALFDAGKFVQNQSQTKEGVLFDKVGVYAHALGREDWPIAPNLLAFTREIALAVPQMFNLLWGPEQCRLQVNAFTSKLAATTTGASYPLHVDNPPGEEGDRRKVTLVYYLNPEWREPHQGQFRAFEGSTEHSPYWDIPPLGDSLVVFWSRALLHEVLAHRGPEPRFAQTVWLTE